MNHLKMYQVLVLTLLCNGLVACVPINPPKPVLLTINNDSAVEIINVYVKDYEQFFEQEKWQRIPIKPVTPGDNLRLRLAPRGTYGLIIEKDGAESETRQRFRMPDNGLTISVTEPRPVPKPPVAASRPATRSPSSSSPAPTSTVPAAGSSIAANVDEIRGTWQTKKVTYASYGHEKWKVLEIEANGRATWEWMTDFTNSTLRKAGDSCHWESTRLQLKYEKNPDGSLALSCLDRKEHKCDGRVEQRGCFDHKVPLRVTEDGIYVDNGDNDGVYTRQ